MAKAATAQAVPVTVSLNFHIDPVAWALTYGEDCTIQNIRDYFENLDASALAALVPASDEWVTDTDQTEVKVKVGRPIGP